MAGPQFRDLNGNVISTIPCGEPYVFDVPGFSVVNLALSKADANGNFVTPVFNGSYNVPMSPYTSSCVTDPGIYLATANDANTGAYLGNATLTITPGGATSTIMAGLSTTELAIGAGILLFLFTRKKGK
jgi:hypothetical protein